MVGGKVGRKVGIDLVGGQSMNGEEALRLVDELIFLKTDKHLGEAQALIFPLVWEGEKYSTIAETLGYTEQHVKDTGYGLWRLLSEVIGEKVTKNNIRLVLKYHLSQPPAIQATLPTASTRIDWGDAPDLIEFYGRAEELATLEQWIVSEKCRLVALLGMGGMGKTSLSIKLIEQIQEYFQYVIWQSIRESPPINRVLDEWLKFLSNQQETDFSGTVSDKIRRLLHYLQSSRCLLVLDNTESIMTGDGHLDQYLPDYEKYGDLLERIGSSRHQSCLLLTSRAKPSQIAKLEGKTRPVRSLPLDGLQPATAIAILHDNELYGQENEAMSIAEIYSGNPLALNLVSRRIQELFNGDMTEFLSQGTPIFNGIAELLDEQFDRMPDLEKSVMYWLAIEREPVSIEKLGNDLIPVPAQRELQDALEHLTRRSLIERVAKGFSLQNVILEYVVNRFVEEIRLEIASKQFDIFNRHPLLEATARDYIRNAQIRSVLKPIAETIADCDRILVPILEEIRDRDSLKTGYAAGNLLNLLCYLNADLSRYDFSGLTIRQAYLQGRIVQDVSFAHCDLSKTVFTQDFGIVFSVAHSPDGKLLATGHSNGTISIWESDTGKELLNCIGHSDRVYAVTFSPSGDMLASGSDDSTVRLWEVRTGVCLKTLLGHSSAVGAIAFNPSGDILASGSEDRTVRLWDVPGGACLKILEGHTNHVWSVAFNPTGELLASGSFDRTIRLWDVTIGTCQNVLIGHNEAIASVAFNSSGELLASGSHDKTIRLWELDSGACVKILQGHDDRIWSVAFSPSGERIASGSYDKTVRLWNIQTGACENTLSDHANWVRSVSFNPKRDSLATGGYDNKVKIWDLSGNDCLQTFEGYQVSICAIAISPSGDILASGSDDRAVRLWDIPSRTYSSSLSGHGGWVYAVAFGPSDGVLASGSSDKTVRLWNIYNGNCLNTLQGHNGWVCSVSFSPVGDVLASSSSDKTVRLWDISSGACTNILQGHEGTIGSVAFSPNGKLLASGSLDRAIAIWDLRSGNCLRTLQGHSDQIWSVAWSPDSQLLASCSFDRTIRIWNVKSGKCLKVLSGHTNYLLSVAWSPNGQLLASGGYDKTVRLWEAKSGECIGTLKEHTNWVRAIAFAPDSQTIISGSQDETIKFWDVATGDCLKTLKAPRPYQGMNITGITGLTEAEKTTLKLLGAFEESRDRANIN